MGAFVTTGKPRASALSGSSVRSLGFFPKLKLPGVPRYVLPGWENEDFDTVTVTSGQMVYTPILVSETTTYTRIFIKTVNPSVAGLCRLGVYRFQDGAPGSLVLDAGTVATDPPGVKEIVIALLLQPGYYFLARVCDAAAKFQGVRDKDPLTYPLSAFSIAQDLKHDRTLLAVAGQ
ncbi:hypothetical protein ACFLX9_04665, partial [Chloroflexota bacterium]